MEDILLREVLMDLMDLKETLIKFRKCQQREKILGDECKKSRKPKIWREFENWKNSCRKPEKVIELGFKERVDVANQLSKDGESSENLF